MQDIVSKKSLRSQDRKKQWEHCNRFVSTGKSTEGGDLLHVPGAPNRTPERGLWLSLLPSLHHCKEQGVSDLPRRDNEKAISRLCVLSVGHQGHEIFCMEEEEKLQGALKKLRKEQQEAVELEADIREERSILHSLEQKELQKLEEDKVNVLENLVSAKDQLFQQSQKARLRSGASDVGLINRHSRSETWTWKDLKMVSKKLKRIF
ncbi:hypothetical protein HPG69_005766 [Diceros bicornis minor]|uniref:Uncharacterized protein n=1 Tax=Diceros bicornis minor TaxID=77932 RepID=A0A7J7ESF2_DICBM|nr:hypothetical protein HPG69_005766 [Diceros bicornis minor]